LRSGGKIKKVCLTVAVISKHKKEKKSRAVRKDGLGKKKAGGGGSGKKKGSVSGSQSGRKDRGDERKR